MHDPMTVAFDIKNPFSRRQSIKNKEGKIISKGYKSTLITIWHNDPEKDGSDDSCGWFPRSRHGNQETLNKIINAFKHEWDTYYDDRCFGWFKKDGSPNLSTTGIVLNMYNSATHEYFKYDWNKRTKFMKKHLYHILLFAENNVDSLFQGINQIYGERKREERINEFAHCIYGDILRKLRPWYKHPKWHIHHWSIQIYPLMNLRRFIFSKCKYCKLHFKYGESPVSGQWDSIKPKWFKSEEDIYHQECFTNYCNIVSNKQETNVDNKS